LIAFLDPIGFFAVISAFKYMDLTKVLDIEVPRISVRRRSLIPSAKETLSHYSLYRQCGAIENSAHLALWKKDEESGTLQT